MRYYIPIQSDLDLVTKYKGIEMSTIAQDISSYYPEVSIEGDRLIIESDEVPVMVVNGVEVTGMPVNE